MRILLVGTGPVAKVVLVSLRSDIDVHVLGSTPGLGTLAVSTNRLRPYRHGTMATTSAPFVDDPSTETWDAIITTAPPSAVDLGDLLSGSPDAPVVAVSQVPSELDALANITGSRPSGLLVANFLATRDTPTRWWLPTGTRFSVAGPTVETLGASLFTGRDHVSEIALVDAMIRPATTMPFIAGLQITQYDSGALRSRLSGLARAANEARAAVFAHYGNSDDHSGPVRPIAARVALGLLPRLAPFDVMLYIKQHFGGHSEQTLQFIDDWRRLADRHDLRHDHLDALRADFVEALLEP